MAKTEKTKKCNLELKEIDGIKFRIMWSTKALYSFIYLSIMIIIFISFCNFSIYKSFSIDFYELAPIVFVLVPFILLISLVNNKLLGKIVAVINENGIYTENRLIPWNGISEICYKINVPFSRSRDKFEQYCYLEIHARGQKYRILHAPHKMIKYIKQYVPDVKVKKDKEFIVGSAIIICILIIIPFINKLKK